MKKGNVELIDRLRKDPQLISEKLAVEALHDLELLFQYLKLFNVTDKVNSFLFFVVRMK